ncbi:MAG TPA: methyl-accepting chemotaxis protein, partial [Rectinemataceae bacterium]|nr:methyl-accepting chemotaxis protein [Rectinemataceae bacterium]
NRITGQVKEGSAQMLAGSHGVLDEMNRLTDMTREITDRMNEMAQGTSQITAVMGRVSEVSEQNRERLAVLKKEVSWFRLGARR